MFRFLLIFFSVVALIAGVFFFSRTSSVARPIVILDSLKSGDTEQSVRQALATYKLQDEERNLENQYHKSHVVLDVDNYQTSGCSGQLVLQFYDGGLYDAWFYPDDFQFYKTQLKKEGIDLDQANPIQKYGLQIWSRRDGESKLYVGREDLEISRKIED